MIATLKEVLADAKKNKYAVGLFNTVNLEMARGVLAAAEETGSPVIIGSAEVLLPFASLEELAAMLLPKAREAKVPVVVHYDHGLTEEKITRAMELGFSSIMYDCSTLGYDDNCRALKKMTDLAHSKGITVEAELGHVGDNEGVLEGAKASASLFTDPVQAADYVSRTGCDALAVSIGNAHGAYKLPPKLDFERLAELNRAVPVPLVLHGGSGLSDDDFKKAIEGGICKVNIFTDINRAAARAAYEAYTPTRGMTELGPIMTKAVYDETVKKMVLFGSVGRA